MGKQLLSILGVLLLIAGCGGGDGKVSSNAGETGTVAVLLTDGPADGYENIWVWITEISLLTDDESDPVVVFESEDPQGWEVDLLDLRDQETVVTIRDDIPAGHYSIIRLRIADIVPVAKTEEKPLCDDLEVKLPGGKIDLNPQGGFDIVPGETIGIKLDIDCDKSIQLHPAGKTGKCIFRPVVFVDIEPIEKVSKCPRVLKGTIEALLEDQTGFTLNLGEGRNLIRVLLKADTVIFGENGMPAGEAALAPGQLVHVRGRLDPEGGLQASVIVIGRVILLKGTVETAFDGEAFTFDLIPPHVFDVNTVSVAVGEDTFVMTGCDQQVDADMIQPGMLARVVGKVSLENQSIQAVAVMLKDERIVGQLTAATGPDDEGSYLLTVQTAEAVDVDVTMPASVAPYMSNIGPLDMDDIQALLGCGQTLAVSLVVAPGDDARLIAASVRVYAQKVEGVVTDLMPKDADGMVQAILDDLYVVDIPASTVVQKQQGDSLEGVSNELIALDDHLLVLGLNTCDDAVDIQAYMVIVLSPAEP